MEEEYLIANSRPQSLPRHPSRVYPYRFTWPWPPWAHDSRFFLRDLLCDVEGLAGVSGAEGAEGQGDECGMDADVGRSRPGSASRRFPCERCGGTGIQGAGLWDGRVYDSVADACDDCLGEGLLGPMTS